jgi:hypothetical protein
MTTATKATRDANERVRNLELALFEANNKIKKLEQENKDLKFYNSMSDSEVKNVLTDAVQALRLYADPKTYRQYPLASLPIFTAFDMVTTEDHEVLQLTQDTASAVFAGKKAREFFRKINKE